MQLFGFVNFYTNFLLHKWIFLGFGFIYKKTLSDIIEKNLIDCILDFSQIFSFFIVLNKFFAILIIFL